MKNIYDRIYETGIIPVIKIEDAANAVPLAKALIDGGLPAAEITFRTAAAADAIKAITEAYPDMVVGAGTVLNAEQADAAKAAGAQFIVKFFPAEAAGGLPMLKAMAAPYGAIKFMPTGGLNENNILNYLSFNKILACGGSFMVKDEYIKNQEFDKIKALTENAVKLMLGFKIKHVGINAENADAAMAIAKTFAPFGLDLKDGNSSIFVGSDIEVMKSKGYGKLGHIAIETNFIKRAEAYLKNKGLKLIEESKKIDAKGDYKAVYIDADFGGFAVHLLQK